MTTEPAVTTSPGARGVPSCSVGGGGWVERGCQGCEVIKHYSLRRSSGTQQLRLCGKVHLKMVSECDSKRR